MVASGRTTRRAVGTAGEGAGQQPPSEFSKISVTVPTELLTRVRNEVGPRGVSRYLSRSADRELRRDALRRWLDEMLVEHGEIPDEIVAEVDEAWRSAGG